MNEREKRKRLLRYWLLGTFVIVFAAVTTYISLYTGNWGQSVRVGLPITSLVGMSAMLIYLGYRFLDFESSD